MDCQEILSGLLLELRRGTLVLAVLSQLNRPTYGYNLIQTLTDNGVPIEANTLYPLLRRLETQGVLQSEWETGGSKPRKYYALTDEGRVVYGKLREHWRENVRHLDQLLEGEL